MIKGVGTDIIEISRIEKAVRKSDAFTSRVFTPREISDCSGVRIKWASLAARYAAKEAVSKALGTGIGKIKWVEIEIVKDTNGKPEVKLYGNACERAKILGIANVSVSLSHSREYAVAFVIAY